MKAVRDLTGRLRSRRSADRRRAWARWLGAGAAVALLAALVYLVAFSPALAARAVEVTGAKLLNPADVVTAAAVPVGTPMIFLDPGQVAERVAGLPPVAEVEVARVWPGTVRVSVRERKARLALAAGGGFLLADASGVVFRAVADPPGGLILVEAAADDQQLLVDVGTVYSALAPQLAAKVSRIFAPTRDGIVLRLRDGTRVVWGSAEQSALKDQVLAALLPLGGTTFDVSAPAFPTRR